MLENLRQRIERAISARVSRPRGALQLRIESLESRSVLSAAGWSDVFAPRELMEPRLHFDRADTPADFGTARESLTFAAIGGIRGGDVRMMEATSLSSKFTQFDERRLVSRDDAFGALGDGSFAPANKFSARAFDQPAIKTPSPFISPWSTGWSVNTTVASNLATGTQVICCTIVSPSFADAAQGMSVVFVWANRMLPTSLNDLPSQHADRAGLAARYGGLNAAPFSNSIKSAAASAITLRADRPTEPSRDATPPNNFVAGSQPSFDPPAGGHSTSTAPTYVSDRVPPSRGDAPRMISLGALGDVEYRHDLSDSISINVPTVIEAVRQNANAPVTKPLPTIDPSQGGMVFIPYAESFGGSSLNDRATNEALIMAQPQAESAADANEGSALMRYLREQGRATNEESSTEAKPTAKDKATTGDDASSSPTLNLANDSSTAPTTEALANDPIIRQARASDAVEGGMIALISSDGAPADLPAMSEDAGAHREFVAAAAEHSDLESREIRMDASFDVFQAFEMVESDIDHLDTLATPVIIAPVSMESQIDAAAAATRLEENVPTTAPAATTAVLAGIGVAGGMVIAGRGRDRQRREPARRPG